MPPRPAAHLAARPSSLADVARLAGVSTGTVSRVLSRPELISPATRERVMAAVERLRYVANGSARALARRRTGTVGALVPRFGSSSFPMLIQGLESVLAQAGYTLLLSAPEHGRGDMAMHLRALLERGVDAVALLGSRHPAAVLDLLAAHRVPHVQMWAPPTHDGRSVGFDEHEAAARVVDHLASLGHRKVAFIGGRTADNERARRRQAGVMRALARHGMELDPKALVETDYGFAQGHAAALELMQRRGAFTAIVCGNDYLAAGVLSALDGLGCAVPQRMSVASFNDNDFAAYLHPPLTTVRIPIREMGEASARLLLGQLAGEPPTPLEPLPLQLFVRGSTGPVRTAGRAPRR